MRSILWYVTHNHYYGIIFYVVVFFMELFIRGIITAIYVSCYSDVLTVYNNMVTALLTKITIIMLPRIAQPLENLTDPQSSLIGPLNF